MAMTSAERQRAYRGRQRAKMAVDPEYAEEVRTKRAAQNKAYRERVGREVLNQRWMSWHNTNKDDPEYVEKRRESDRKYYHENKDSRNAAYRQWAEDNNRSEYNREWARANPDKIAERDRRRKALLKGATEIESFTKTEVWKRDQGICGICNEPADPKDWHLDHVIPLSKGGQHTFRNVQVSHPRCNQSKKDKLP